MHMRVGHLGAIAFLLLALGLSAQFRHKTLHRTPRQDRSTALFSPSQPVPDPITEQDVRKAKMPPRFELTAPKGAPNVLVVLIDDMGFGQPAAFGGPIKMPTLDRIANEGLRYTRFHTAAVCSASRAACSVATTRTPSMPERLPIMAPVFLGIPLSARTMSRPLAQILRMNVTTPQPYGKSHETPGWEIIRRAHLIVGRPEVDLRSSTVLSVAT